MQVKGYQFPSFTAKNAGDPVVFNEQKQKKEPLRLQRPQYPTWMAM